MYRKFLRPGWIVGHLMVVLAVLVCLRLGLWQWHRTHEASGTVQNLGYAVLWPVFGAAFIYMWFRFLQLELVKDAEDDAELTRMASGVQAAADPGAAAGTVGPSEVVTVTPTFEPGVPAQTDLTRMDVVSDEAAAAIDGTRSVEAIAGVADEPVPVGTEAVPSVSRRTPSRGYTVAVSTVGDETEEDEPELAAYNRALAALAEKDHRRAR